MTLEKAIEIVTNDYRGNNTKASPDFGVALQLLIEAGKRLAFNRLNTIASSDELLPGETGGVK